MNQTRKITMMAAMLFIFTILSACSSITQEEENLLERAANLGPGEIAGYAATYEALSPEQVAILEEMAVSAGVPTLSPDDKLALIATVDASRATATAVGQAVDSGERVNATAVPDQSPVIVYFFASAPDQAQYQGGIRYFLNWTTQNANRVEIFGHVMDDPVQGSWPVYNESNNWVLWAANDVAWVESSIEVQADQNTGSSLQNVSVGSRDISLTFRDPQFVDGDQIGVDVNGVRVINDFITGGRNVSFPVTLQPGANTISIEARSSGVTPPMVSEITVGNVTAGQSVQVTGGLNVGERQEFVITAP